MLNRTQRLSLLALAGLGLALAGLAYLVPFSSPARTTIGSAFVLIGTLGAALLGSRAIRSKSQSERHANGWAAASVAVNSVIIALLIFGELRWALVASAASAALSALEYRMRSGAASGS